MITYVYVKTVRLKLLLCNVYIVYIFVIVGNNIVYNCCINTYSRDDNKFNN